MIVDLVRNDIGRCRDRICQRAVAAATRGHPGLVHLVSTVEGSCVRRRVERDP